MRRLAAAIAALAVMAAAPGAGADPPPARQVPSEPLGAARCTGGTAGPFPCRNVDLQSFLPTSAIGGGRMAAVWGWRDPETEREYALVGKTTGLAFVDVTKPTEPVYLGSIRKTDPVLIWVDVEVYKDHAFIVSESINGVMIFDLTRLRGVEEERAWAPDLIYPLVPSGHTLRIDPDSGFLYVNGSLALGGHPQIIDISDPKAPRPAGVIADDGYTHDSFCAVYKGPQKRFRNNEICINANEDTLTFYDVTDKAAPEQLARVGYDSASYTHSGWLTRKHDYFLSTDEGDELDRGLPTTTYIWDVRDLTKPKLIGAYHAKTAAIDHNLYIEGDLVYQANYTAGLRILDASKVGRGKLREIGYFDVVPSTDAAEFNGSWGAYPFLDSGNVLVTGMGQGFFVVRPRL